MDINPSDVRAIIYFNLLFENFKGIPTCGATYVLYKCIKNDMTDVYLSVHLPGPVGLKWGGGCE